jgi:hypothetical protein
MFARSANGALKMRLTNKMASAAINWCSTERAQE